MSRKNAVSLSRKNANAKAKTNIQYPRKNANAKPKANNINKYRSIVKEEHGYSSCTLKDGQVFVTIKINVRYSRNNANRRPSN